MSIIAERGRPIRLHSRKFDGSLHYTFAGHVIDETADRLMMFVPAGAPLNSYRGAWASKIHMFNIYWPDRYYNLSVNWSPDWQPRLIYVNIATPATWTSTGIHTIDMDLDVIRGAADQRIVLDDADEFEDHRQRWRYPDELVTACRRAVDEVTDLLHREVFPFNWTIHRWASGEPLARAQP